MHNKIILPLISLSDTKPYFFYNDDMLTDLKQELEDFLNDSSNSYMNDLAFAETFMGCQEIKSNNSVEGYNEDVATIMQVIGNHHEFSLLSKDRNKIIGNLYRGYKKILEGKEINKKNLRELYNILSDGLLSEDDLENMGEYYRQAPVYIYYSSYSHIEPDEGAEFDKIEECIDSLFSYLEDNNSIDSFTDYFIKSQIAHYYFVHIHPFFDVNGRTSRTLGMWYLLNHKAYPYIIFNRAIPLTVNRYYKIIRDVNSFRNVTFFLNYMMENVKIELEKEHVISQVKDNVHGSISELEYQALLYILSMNGVKSCKDFISLYNRLNKTKSALAIKDGILLPLVDRGILKVVRQTKTGFNDGSANFIFEINPALFEIDPAKVKRLKL